MKTRDGFYVSDLTRMCEHHGETAAAYMAMTLDFIGPLGRWKMSREDECRHWLARMREECVEVCGRESDDAAHAFECSSCDYTSDEMGDTHACSLRPPSLTQTIPTTGKNGAREKA